jgi:flavin reductase (DIM6/NTAB) family NADH-FMN oxidoreductase RutF
MDKIRCAIEDLPKALFFLHRPVSTMIVTAHHNGKDNALAIGLHTLITHRPPICGVSLTPERFSYPMIRDSKEFGVNFVTLDKVELIAYTGGCSGRKVDKFQKFGIAKEKPIKTSVPILKDAYVSYECKLIDDRPYGGHRWLVGEIVAVHYAKDAFTTEKKTLDLDKYSPTLALYPTIFTTARQDTIRRMDPKTYGTHVGPLKH